MKTLKWAEVLKDDYIPRLKSGKDGSEQLFDLVAFSSAENYDVLCAVAWNLFPATPLEDCFKKPKNTVGM